ncbi:MAG: winged helix-turn-helix transcriptional regulator [Candidatus Thorarchaeota archaeon]
MDKLDKQLLLKLICNCRQSYRTLAKDLGVTCPTIKRRVDLLMESGIITGFTVDISQETLGVGWAIAQITTDNSEDRATLVDDICAHEATTETFVVGSRSYVAFAEVTYSNGLYEYGKYLRSLSGVIDVDIQNAQQIPTSQLSYKCKFNSRGNKVEFTSQQRKVLRLLVEDARMPIQDLSERTRLKPKRIRRIIKELREGGGVHFTIKFNPCTENCISFLLLMRFDESVTGPKDIVELLEDEFPMEYWLTFMLSNEPVLINYMSSYSLARIEEVIRKMKQVPCLKNVDTMLIYHIEKSQENGALLATA